MAYCVSYNKAYDIPPPFLLNSDQMNIYLVPTTRECRWENKAPNEFMYLACRTKGECLW